jgi:hypothetical protein
MPRVRYTIKPYRVVVRYSEAEREGRQDDPNGPYQWCLANAGRMDMDLGDWFVTCFDFQGTDVYRFLDPNTAMLFKLTFGGA